MANFDGYNRIVIARITDERLLSNPVLPPSLVPIKVRIEILSWGLCTAVERLIETDERRRTRRSGVLSTQVVSLTSTITLLGLVFGLENFTEVTKHVSSISRFRVLKPP